MCDTAPCQHGCQLDMYSATKYICTCNEGWKLTEDGVTCAGTRVHLHVHGHVELHVELQSEIVLCCGPDM